MTDLLKMEKINSLPHPLWLQTWRGNWWPVIDICVQTGLCRIDVCGLPEVVDFGDIRDDSGVVHSAEDFYHE